MRTTDKSNHGDKVVKIIRVYESGRVRAARTPAGGWNAKGRAHALPSDVTDKPSPTFPATVVGERVKNPAKVAAGKARAAKAAAAKVAATKPTAKKAPAKARKPAAKATKPKAKAKPASPFPTVAKAKKAAKAKAKAKPKQTRNPPSANAMVVVAFRVSAAQKRKLVKLGGGEFIRERIERATIPAKA